MGFFDTIKKVYKKADTKVGGYLPGGKTPQQVSASKTPTTTKASTTNKIVSTTKSIAKAAIAPAVSTIKAASKFKEKVDEKVPGGLFGDPSLKVTDPTTGEKVGLVAEAVPLSVTALGGIPYSNAISLLTKTTGGSISNTALYGSKVQPITTGAKVITNTKSAKQAASLMKKVFSKKTLTILGAAASSIFLGQWGQAEAGEPISIVMRDILRKAEETGDYTLYDEAKEARDEVTNLDIWDKIALWSPASPIIGIPNKIKGAIAGGILMDKMAEDAKNFTGETEDEKFARLRVEKQADEKANVDYYNEQRIITDEAIRLADEEQRDDDAKFWAKQRDKIRAEEEADRIAIAEFWEAYRRELEKIKQDARPSNLNFGIL